MGTQLEQGRTQFCIKAVDKAAALAAVKALATRTGEKGDPTGDKRLFSWVTTERFEQADTLEEALEAWRWRPDTDEADDIINLEFTGEKLSDEDTLFAALAPFVVAGSYIEALAEGEPFRWRFEEGRCFTDNGQVAYDAGPLPRLVIENIQDLLYADGPNTAWSPDTLDAIADEVAKVILRPGKPTAA